GSEAKLRGQRRIGRVTVAGAMNETAWRRQAQRLWRDRSGFHQRAPCAAASISCNVQGGVNLAHPRIKTRDDGAPPVYAPRFLRKRFQRRNGDHREMRAEGEPLGNTA